ncbi:MAG: ABC-type transport auxiliary lipoprotein family protein, partial [Methyloceanibacter sp.]
MTRSAPIIALGLMCLGLAGCALALGGSAAPTTYDLIAPRSFAATAKPARWQLVVNEPTAVHALDTDRIMVRPRADQISYYKGVAWSDRLPHLLQVRTIETLQNSGAVKAVTSSSDRVDGDYSLSMEIRAFQIDAGNGRPAADVDIFAKLIDNNSSRVVATKGFSTRVPAASDAPAAGVAALNQALAEVLQD